MLQGEAQREDVISGLARDVQPGPEGGEVGQAAGEKAEVLGVLGRIGLGERRFSGKLDGFLLETLAPIVDEVDVSVALIGPNDDVQLLGAVEQKGFIGK